MNHLETRQPRSFGRRTYSRWEKCAGGCLPLLVSLWACSYSYVVLLPQFARGYRLPATDIQVLNWSDQHSVISRMVVGAVCFVTSGGAVSPDDVRSLNDVSGLPALIVLSTVAILGALLINGWLEIRSRFRLSIRLAAPVGIAMATLLAVVLFTHGQEVADFLLDTLKHFS